MEAEDPIQIPPCYQCGSSEPAFTEETADDGWIRCGACGERLILASELRAAIVEHEERAIRRKLGVDEFLHARRIDDKAAEE